jgi:glucan biosynthesis protein C
MPSSTPNTSDKRVAPQRRNDLDWLRIIAISGVFFLHVSRFFDPMDWDVKNNILSDNIMIFVLFIVQWLMPLFFLISGMSIYFVLTFMTKWQFVKSRFLRIMVPYLFIGLFVILPPQNYLNLISTGRFTGTFVEYYPKYLTYNFGDITSINLPMGHLWYLVYLFIFSLAMLPLFTYLGTGSGRALISRTSFLFDRTGAIFLFSLPVAFVLFLLDPSTPAGDPTPYGGWSLWVYPIILFYGYLIVSNDNFEEAILRHGKAALVLAVLTFPLVLWSIIQFLTGEAFPFGTYEYDGVMLLRAFNLWCFIIAFLSYGRQHLNFSNSVLKYATEGVIAFYILHQTVIQIVGYFIGGWDMGILPKFVILAVISFIVIMALYELIIRRINVIRFLFGMKRK